MTSKQQCRHIIHNDPEDTPTVCDSTTSTDFLTATTLPLGNSLKTKTRTKYNTKYKNIKYLVTFDDSVIMNLGFAKVWQSKTMKSQFLKVTERTHILIKSQCFYHVEIGSDNINCARSLVCLLYTSDAADE